MAIVAHPDDEIIGLGGTLAKHVNSGDEVKVVILGDGKTSRYDQYTQIDPVQKNESDQETTAALKLLGISNFIKKTLPDNKFDSLPLLDIVKIVAEQIQSFQPQVIYTHHHGDLNIDHQITAEAVIIATRPIEYEALKRLLMFETLSSTEMAGPRNTSAFLPNVFIDISNELDQKLAAMNCYQSELREFPHPRSLKAIQMNAELWGAKSGFSASESFVLFRENII